MAIIEVHCPKCQGTQVIKHGKSPEGKQRYLCQNAQCDQETFMLDYTYKARQSGVKDQIVDMTMNGSGVRDIARVLKISPNTVITELKKKNQSFNQ